MLIGTQVGFAKTVKEEMLDKIGKELNVDFSRHSTANCCSDKLTYEIDNSFQITLHRFPHSAIVSNDAQGLTLEQEKARFEEILRESVKALLAIRSWESPENFKVSGELCAL
ncbi:MAG: hypothetical protein H7Y30_04080 [Pyrinomonadaceae bacterium]|nr:hypothetical protein [Pyrinomonadaceae bacterium]